MATEKWTNDTRRHKCQILQGKQKIKEHIKLHLFHCKISTLFLNYHYYRWFCRTQKLSWHLWRKNTSVLGVYKFYVAIYCTWQSIWMHQIIFWSSIYASKKVRLNMKTMSEVMKHFSFKSLYSIIYKMLISNL